MDRDLLDQVKFKETKLKGRKQHRYEGPEEVSGTNNNNNRILSRLAFYVIVIALIIVSVVIGIEGIVGFSQGTGSVSIFDLLSEK